MPATEQTWRKIGPMHVIFGLSSVAMLVTTIWMLAADNHREWKAYQRQFRNVAVTATDARIAELKTTDWRNKEANSRKRLPPPNNSRRATRWISSSKHFARRSTLATRRTGPPRYQRLGADCGTLRRFEKSRREERQAGSRRRANQTARQDDAGDSRSGNDRHEGNRRRQGA